ncbi:MAG: Npt1/Npt2 family nucleotide transporter [Candidatus Dependentiae bacterium]
MLSGLKRVAQSLWGKFENRQELMRFLQLAIVFGLIIGTYWSLRTMKDSIFNAIVGGTDYLWFAKIISLVINVPLVIIYSKMTDIFPRHKFFCFLTVFYGIATLGFAWAFTTETMGLMNTVASPDRYIGWAWYAFVESFGSLVVALFWAFTTDITKPDAAKRGFPLIILFAQLANIVFPFFMSARKMGFTNSAPVVAICAGLMFAMALLMLNFIRTVPEKDLVGYAAGNVETTEEEGEPGFFEGLKLLLTKGYLFGIFLIISVYEIIVTIVDNHFKVTTFSAHSGEANVQALLSQYATWTGIVAMACVLLGINNIQRKLGMTASLLVLPPLVGLAIVLIKFNPASLNIAFWIMVFSKAVNYALTQPTIKQLYIPTTKDTKYKATAWIETFGSRLSKAGGSSFAGLRSVLGVNSFLSIAAMASMGMIGIWVLAAMYIAKKYNKAIKDDTVVC